MEVKEMFSGAEVESVLDSLPIALVTTDHEGQIVAVNEAALALFGYTSSELLGSPIEILIPKRFAKVHPGHYRQFVKEPATRPMGEGRDLSAIKKNGEEFPVEVGITILPTESRHFLASVIDISFRKQTEILLRERQDVLESSLAEAKQTLEEEISERTRLEERQRLGRELHDSLSQNLYGMGLGLRTSLAKLKKGNDPTDALEYCLNLTEASLIEMRALLFKLRPKSLENVPLADVLTSHSQAVTARTKIAVNFVCQNEPKAELPFNQKYTLYRIVTEAIHNTIKHAEAKQIDVTLLYERDSTKVSIIDDGRGFDVDQVASGHGLASMRERAHAAQGTLELKSNAKGTEIIVTIPKHLMKATELQ